MSDFNTKKIELRLLQRQLGKYEPVPATTDPLFGHYEALKNEILAAEKAIVEIAMNEDVKPDIRTADTTHNAWQETTLMTSYIANLKFSGKSDEDCENLVTKLKAFGQACPGTSFLTIWNAVQPVLPANIIRTLQGKDIQTLSDLKKVISSTYGSHSNIHQKLETFFNKQKNYKTPFPQHQSDLQASIAGIASVHKEWLRRRACLSRAGALENRPYEPTYDDALELVNLLKLLTDIRTQEEQLFRTISIELSSILTPEQLATRAEQVRQQVTSNTSFNAASRGKKNSRPGSNDSRKNKNADKGSKDASPSPKNRSDKNDKKSQGGRKSYGGQAKPAQKQSKYGAHYTTFDDEQSDEDGAFQLRDATGNEEQFFSDASGDESVITDGAKN